jgi:hypothetical protein
MPPPPPRVGFLKPKAKSARKRRESWYNNEDFWSAAVKIYLLVTVAFIALISLTAMAGFGNSGPGKTIIGVCSALILLTGGIAFLLSGAGTLIIVAQDGFGHLLGCLLVPFYALYLLITRWDRLRGPFFLNLAPVGVMIAMALLLPAVQAARQAAARAAAKQAGVENPRLGNFGDPPPGMPVQPPGLPGMIDMRKAMANRRFNQPGNLLGNPGFAPNPNMVNPAPKPRPAEAEPPNLQGQQLLEYSLQVLRDSTDLPQRFRAVLSLRRIRPDEHHIKEAEHTLIALLEKDPVLAGEAAKTLAAWKTPGAISVLLNYLHDERPIIRHEAIRALGKTGEAGMAAPILSCLRDNLFEVRDAVKDLGAVAEPALISHLSDDDDNSRRVVLELLSDLGGMDTLKAMRAMAPDSNPEIRNQAQRTWQAIVARVSPPPDLNPKR